MGVLQQPAYQRTIPFSVRRMQANASAPWVKVTFLGSVCTTSDPPCASKVALSCPKKRAKAWQSRQ